jgi:hypothetical protein
VPGTPDLERVKEASAADSKRASKPSMSAGPTTGICHVVDEVNIVYNGETKTYHAVFRKVVRNESQRPRDHMYARIDICAVPEDPELAQAYYNDNPISMEGIKFRARDGYGRDLDVHVLHRYPSNIEMHLRFRDRSSGEFFPIYKGDEIEVIYECEVSDRHWGPYLRRHVRLRTDHLAVRLAFPRALVRLWGNEEVGDNVAPLTPAVEKTTEGGNDVYTWSSTSPDPESIFTFRWTFADGRDKALYEELRNRYKRQNAP